MGTLNQLTISVKVDKGISVTSDGSALTMAFIDSAGKVVAHGDELAMEVHKAVLAAYEELWVGNGHLEVIRRVPSL